MPGGSGRFEGGMRGGREGDRAIEGFRIYPTERLQWVNGCSPPGRVDLLVRDTLERLVLMVVAASDHADLEHCLDDIVSRFT